jgi:hypothetical protein
VSKPDPAIYAHACRALGIAPSEAVAVEDSVPGVRSAVSAGVTTIGNVQFVAAAERPERIQDLERAGAVMVVSSWTELDDILGAPPSLPGGSRSADGSTANDGRSASDGSQPDVDGVALRLA